MLERKIVTSRNYSEYPKGVNTALKVHFKAVTEQMS